MTANSKGARDNRGKPSRDLWGKLILWFCVLDILAIVAVAAYQFAPRRPAAAEIPNPDGGPNIEIAYPSSTTLCLDGCQPHQNWIEFILPPGGYFEPSLKLKTTLIFGQVLTMGVGARRCYHQQQPGYSCVDMELSHRLLSLFAGLYLTPLSQLRDTSNWWLEYTP